ncbi:non-ribosomal peptide synthetase, partial [Methylobacterium brachythecii]|uniref:non-ribosomal peptide synthetase n=1 Tax=Methylobacterium brachythecii TaxID=1176177 RepID=UPI0024E0415E
MRNDSLVDRLRSHAALKPEARALRFLDGDTLGADLTYAELDTRIRAVAAHLQQGVARGERALLLFPNSVDYVVAFYACLYAGVIAVPAYPPVRGRSQHATRLRGIMIDAQPRFILTTEALSALVAAELPPDAETRIIAVDGVPVSAASDWREASPVPDDIAFLQYTSGSTAQPKGVCVSHANLAANERAITDAFRMSQDDIVVSWLPLFHDMGLIGGLLQPLYLGIPAVLMDPKSFTERPRRWLETIQRFGATFSGGPDFAYALCADRISDAVAETLDLSTWRIAFSGSEFVRAGTLNRFTRRFAASRFSPKALCPGYGLAEATLFVTGSPPGESASIVNYDRTALGQGRVVEAEDGSPLVAAGHTRPDHTIHIMRTDGSRMADQDTIGEIWVRGPSVARGYWRNEAATQAAFVETESGHWLRTGDLGFVRRDGGVVVTGRIKDMLIVRGQNLFALDIETAVEAEIEAVRPGRVAAFPVEIDGREGIGIAAEFRRGIANLVPAETLREALAKAVVQACGEAPVVSVLLNPRGMPLTTSGKLQRAACGMRWENGLDSFAVFVGGKRLEAVADTAPFSQSPHPEVVVGHENARSLVDAAVLDAWREALGISAIVPTDDFFMLGGNSIAAAQAAAALRETLKVELDLSAFFRHPTLSAFAAHVGTLPRAAEDSVPPVVPVSPAAPLALSHAQERLWFLWQMDPASTAYMVAGAIRLRGNLDAGSLSHALDAVVARHEALRTTFEAGDGGGTQIIHEAAPVPVEIVDLTVVDGVERADAIAARTQDALAVPFDLTTGPLLRASLLRLGPGEHEFVLTAHHIVVDGISMGVLLDEIGALYLDAAASLPPLPVQYADYAAWQRNWLGAGEGERQLGFWAERLGTEHPVLTLPHDRPRPAQQSHRGDTVTLAIEVDLAGRVRALARTEQASTFMVLLAAYAVLLHRNSGESDLRIGVPTANRRLKPLEGLIGFFVNTLVLRLSTDDRLTFSGLLAQTKHAVIEALAHQDIPFERVVERLAPERNLGHNPLFQAKFNYMAEPRGFTSVPGLDAEIRIVDLAGAHFDLALDILDGAEGMKATFNFATDLFDRDTIERIAAQFGDVLRQVAVAADRPLADLTLPEAARRAIAIERQAFTAATFPQLFANAVQSWPEAEAVVDAEGGLTYAELDARSNGLATDLRARTIAAETRVAILAERSNAFVIALLGVMKAGGVAVPLDPSWPLGRIRAVLDDAGIATFLSAGDALTLARETGRTVIDAGSVSPQPGSAAFPAIDPHQAAYVIYTSGSTGKPKGVVVAHGALANYVQALLLRLQPEPGDVMAMVSTPAADLGHTVLFGALASGASLHPFPREDAFDAALFAARMRDHAVDILKIVPSHLRGLIQADASGGVLPRKTLVLGGEACDPALVAEIRRLRPTLRILNHYGPTETTVGVLTHEVGEPKEVVPVGLPLANCEAHVLDASLNPVPASVAAELYVGGDGLARGYLGNPLATAERFVPNPFGAPGSRLYRTGDRVRADRDGNLVFLGRSDDQIKLRGYRIEPREIAQMLAADPTLADAAVLAQPVALDEPARQLVAYVTAAPGAAPEPAALKTRLAGQLPDYMVPAHILLLDRLPLTANGKLDRKALPLPEAAPTATAAAEPMGDVEQAIAEIWCQVLRRDSVGATDNFFELGGDSILSLQVIARLRKRGIKLTPKQIFDRQTVRSLAEVAGAVAPKAPASKPVEAPATSIPLLPIQDRFFAEVTVDRHHWNQSLLLAARERLDPEPLAKALQALLDHHEALTTRFDEGASGWRAERGASAPRADLLRRVSAVNSAAVAGLCAEVQASLDLGAGRLVQALLIDRSEGGQHLLLAIHHLAVDGVSWRVLLEDLATAYAQASEGRPIDLGAKTDSFAQWATRLREPPAPAAELPFWLAQGNGLDAGLPSDRIPATPELLADAETVACTLDAGLTRRLLTEAPSAYRTQVNDLLLAALARTLSGWSGQDAVLVELEGHGREDVLPGMDVSRTVGWFTTVFPLRLEGAGDEAGALIKRTKDAIRALPERGIGYGLLSRFGSAEQRAALEASPQPQVTFNYLGQLDASFDSDSLFALTDEDPGSSRSPKAPFGRPLGIVGEVREGCLRLSWRYGRQRHDRATIARLAELYADTLRDLVEHCAGASGLTPSDVPLAGLDQAGLDSLLGASGLDPRGTEDIYPLAPTQAGILFHSLSEGDSRRTYVNQIAVTVEGIDGARIEAAWTSATRRHAVLRTSIHWQGLDGTALQIVHADPALPLVVDDWRGADGLERRIAEAERAEHEAPFALDRAPLQRVRLIRLDDAPGGRQRHRLIWTSHHILMDGWSSARLLAEIMGAEGAASSGGRYRDYIAWLATRDQAAAEGFWREELAPLDEPTLLAPALHRSGTGEPGHGSLPLALDGDAFARLSGFARRERITLNTLVQGAWTLALRRLTGRDAVVFGATVAGRPDELPGAQDILGLFINTLPVIDDASPATGVAAWLRTLQDRNLRLREHEHTALGQIQTLAGRPGQPLFDTIVVFENYPIDETLLLEGEADSARPAFTDLRHASPTNYALTLYVFAGADRLDLRFDHDLALFSAEQVDLIRSSVAGLLAALCEDAERSLGTVSAADDVARIAAALAATRAADAADGGSLALMPEAIAARAARHPDAVALVEADGALLSYGQLEARAERLAAHLRGLGVGAGSGAPGS